MSATYRLFGAESSAFSTKLRSYLRYKGLEHEWIVRNAATEDTLQEVSRFATLPVLVTASGFAVHDTTPTIEALEVDSPVPEAIPEDRACAFLAVVLEDYADLWLSKSVTHYRWGRKKDQKEAATRAIDEYFGDTQPDNRTDLIKESIVRMEEQFPRMGLNKEVGAVVEKSLKRFVKLLNAHLEKHLYIFGGRPSVADFGIAAQIAQLMKDPTPSKIIEKEAPFVKAWCEFMDDPKASGPFASLEDVKDTLEPLFKKEVGVTFLPWAAANLEASLSRAESVTVTLGKDEISHVPLRSAARSFKDTRRKFSVRDDEADLMEFLEKLGLTGFLKRPERPSFDDDGNGRNGRRRNRRRGRNRRDNQQNPVKQEEGSVDVLQDADFETTAQEVAIEETSAEAVTVDRADQALNGSAHEASEPGSVVDVAQDAEKSTEDAKAEVAEAEPMPADMVGEAIKVESSEPEQVEVAPSQTEEPADPDEKLETNS